MWTRSGRTWRRLRERIADAVAALRHAAFLLEWIFCFIEYWIRPDDDDSE